MTLIDESLKIEIEKLPESRVRDAMEYSLLAGGKRIRPNLLLHTISGYDKEEDLGIEFACALEMIHTYSLIHDDLPAMDNDVLRRGRPTCHVQFDEATAILAGDGLLTYAFETASRSKAPADTVNACLQTLAEYAGAGGMVLGQCLDISEENSATDWKALKNIHHYKTGCLLSAPLKIAALLCDRSHDEVNLWEKVGFNIGLAFQIQDDILDVELTADQFGKSNSDQRNNKVTSVTLLGIEEAEKQMNVLYDKAEGDIRSFDEFHSAELIEMIEKIRTRRK
jgi:geranylgeranyl pyrophosphate synthase